MLILLGEMIIRKTSINIFKLFNILTSERKFLKVSQKLLYGSPGTGILTVFLSFWPSFRDGKGRIAIKWPIHFHDIGSILVHKWNSKMKDRGKSDPFQGGIFQGQA